MSDTLNAARADGVDALVWFEFAKETDWRLSETAAVAKAARTTLRTRVWRQGGDLASVERAVRRGGGQRRASRRAGAKRRAARQSELAAVGGEAAAAFG